MKKILFCLLLLATTSAFASAHKKSHKNQESQSPAVKTTSADVSTSQTSQNLQDKLHKKYPNLILSTKPTQVMPGLYQLWIGNQLVYVNKEMTFMLTGGSLVDLEKGVDYTKAAYADKINHAYANLPIKYAITTVYGKGEREMALFVDPDCPLCQSFEKVLEANKNNLNLTVHRFLVPLDIHPQAYAHATQIMCSTDRLQSLMDWTMKGQLPSGPACQTQAVAITKDYGNSLGIYATPTMLFPNNKTYEGAVNRQDLEKLLQTIFPDAFAAKYFPGNQPAK